MQLITVLMLSIAALLVIGLLLLGGLYPGSGTDQLRWRPTRSPELEARNEVDDLDELREAVNAKRRARGRAELTDDELRTLADGPR